MTHADVQAWLDRYLAAWRSYDRRQIEALFADDATYSYGPFRQPLTGRAAIVDSWLANRDEPGSWAADYRPIAVDGTVAVVHGRTRYFEADGTTVRDEYDNIFEIHFNGKGVATQFNEWYIQKPAPKAG